MSKSQFRNVDHAIRYCFAMREIPIGKFCNLASLTVGRDASGKLVADMLPGGWSELDAHDHHAQAGLIWTRIYGSVEGGKRAGGLSAALRDYVTAQYGWGQVRTVSLYGLAATLGGMVGFEGMSLGGKPRTPPGLLVDLTARVSATLRGINRNSQQRLASHHGCSRDHVRDWEKKLMHAMAQLSDRLERELAPEWIRRGLIEGDLGRFESAGALGEMAV